MKQQHSQSVNENDLSSWIDSEIPNPSTIPQNPTIRCNYYRNFGFYDEIGVIIQVSNNRFSNDTLESNCGYF